MALDQEVMGTRAADRWAFSLLYYSLTMSLMQVLKPGPLGDAAGIIFHKKFHNICLNWHQQKVIFSGKSVIYSYTFGLKFRRLFSF